MLIPVHDVYKFHTKEGYVSAGKDSSRSVEVWSRETPRYVSLGEDSSRGIECGRETSS